MDERITHPKSLFRDVYHYDQDGKLTGWSRYGKNGISKYARDGNLMNGRKIRYETIKTKTKRAVVRYGSKTFHS